MTDEIEERTVIVDEIYLITLQSKITAYEESQEADEKFIENLVQENGALTARLNRTRHELQRIEKVGGAFGEWATRLLKEIEYPIKK